MKSAIDANVTTAYLYDKLNRLTEIRLPNSNVKRFAYDLRGNRITLEDKSNRLNFSNTTYTFDPLGQLSTVTQGTDTTEYRYNPDGLRYIKATPTSTIQYHYNLAGQVAAESDGTGTITANYVWGPDRVLMKKDTATGNEYYYIYNGHGDVIQIIDRNGIVKNVYVYDEWGNILSQSELIDNPFKYAGEIYDIETVLYYLRARYYDP